MTQSVFKNKIKFIVLIKVFDLEEKALESQKTRKIQIPYYMKINMEVSNGLEINTK